MWERGIILFLIFFSLNYAPVFAQSVDTYSAVLEEGRAALEEGHARQALELWDEKVDRSGDGITDPRIGISYVELVTDREYKELYDQAVDMYYWGLSNPDHPVFEEVLSKEVKRLQPIVKREQYKKWRNLLKDEHYSDVGNAMLKFWKLEDPTVTTRYNERLIEHWSRIAYGRENFTRNRSSVYDADDRAEVYVKYGPPDRTRDGIFNFSSGLVQSWIQRAFQIRFTDIGELPKGSDSVSQATARQIMQAKIMQKRNQIIEYERKVRFQHTYPSYEIWVYKDIVENNFTPLIYVFGNEGDGGQFGKLDSVEDLMPNAAFRTAGLQMEVPPSYFLQLMYYQNLVTVDNYFERAYQKLESKLYSMQGVNKWDSRQLRNENQSKLVLARMKAPEEQTTLDEEFPSISLDAHQYRLLNENGEPYLATFVLSNPYRAYFYDQLNERDFDISSYSLAGSVLGTSEEGEIVFRHSTNDQQLKGVEDFYGNIDQIKPEITYYEVPNNEELTNQKFTIELQHKQKDSTRIGKSVFKENIRALGTLSREQKEPISTEDSELQMGDLIVGVRANPSGKNLPFGFRVQPDATINQGETLIVHFEVYNLEERPEPFQIEYEAVEQVGFLKRIFTSREEIRLSLNFEPDGPHFRENLEIDTSPFDPGEYTLELTATEPETGRQINRSIEFTIKEAVQNEE